MPSENKETGKTRFSARVQRNSGFVRFDNAAHWHLNFFVRNGKIFLQSPGLEHIRVLARRGGGIGRHAVLRWQWLRRASSTLALDTTKARGPLPSGKRPFSFAWGKSDLTARRGTILRRLTPSFFKKTTEKPARTILSGLFLLLDGSGKPSVACVLFLIVAFPGSLRATTHFPQKNTAQEECPESRSGHRQQKTAPIY